MKKKQILAHRAASEAVKRAAAEKEIALLRALVASHEATIERFRAGLEKLEAFHAADGPMADALAGLEELLGYNPEGQPAHVAEKLGAAARVLRQLLGREA